MSPAIKKFNGVFVIGFFKHILEATDCSLLFTSTLIPDVSKNIALGLDINLTVFIFDRKQTHYYRCERQRVDRQCLLPGRLLCHLRQTDSGVDAHTQ